MRILDKILLIISSPPIIFTAIWTLFVTLPFKYVVANIVSCFTDHKAHGFREHLKMAIEYIERLIK